MCPAQSVLASSLVHSMAVDYVDVYLEHAVLLSCISYKLELRTGGLRAWSPHQCCLTLTLR